MARNGRDAFPEGIQVAGLDARMRRAAEERHAAAGLAAATERSRMRKDPSDVTRELKLALIVGFALVLTVAILVSDHLSKARTASLASVGGTQKVVAKTPDAPIRSLDELIPAQLPPAIEVSTPAVATTEQPAATDTTVAKGSETSILPPVVIGQQQAGTGHESKFGPGRTGGLGDSIREQSEKQSPATVVIGSTPAPTPVDIVKNEIKKAESPKTAPLAEKTHKIAEGETLFAVSKKYYGDANLWRKLAAANNGKVQENGAVKVGTTIVIPSKESLTGKPETKADPKLAAKPQSKPVPTKPDTKAAKVEDSKTKSYQVRPGDTLMNIAKRQLGSSSRSDEIASLNKIDPDDDLLAGAILKLPAH